MNTYEEAQHAAATLVATLEPMIGKEQVKILVVHGHVYGTDRCVALELTPTNEDFNYNTDDYLSVLQVELIMAEAWCCILSLKEHGNRA